MGPGGSRELALRDKDGADPGRCFGVLTSPLPGCFPFFFRRFRRFPAVEGRALKGRAMARRALQGGCTTH